MVIIQGGKMAKNFTVDKLIKVLGMYDDNVPVMLDYNPDMDKIDFGRGYNSIGPIIRRYTGYYKDVAFVPAKRPILSQDLLKACKKLAKVGFGEDAELWVSPPRKISEVAIVDATFLMEYDKLVGINLLLENKR